MDNPIRRQQYLDVIGIQNWQLKNSSDGVEFDYLVNDDSNTENNISNELTDKIQAFVEEDIVEEKKIEEKHVEEITVVENSRNDEVEPQVQNHITQPVLNENSVVITSDFISTELDDIQHVQDDVENQIPVTDNSAGQSAQHGTDTKAAENKPLISHLRTVELVSELDQTIKNCKQCDKRTTRLNALTGFGNPEASIFVIGEAPTAEEDRSGQYLTEQTLPLFQSMFASIHSQNDFFYTGIIKCYSLTEYLYSKNEVKKCSSFLYNQIQQTKPSVIVVLGAVQAQTILQCKNTFNELRGKTHQVVINDQEYPVVVTYHPAYLLRNPMYKRQALNDLIMIKKISDE
ncbi:MAG: uracil-DNA glycosylase [Gammaproteobacteria bacterium]|nr:uracil-DNA glycosylase [Gammaproteobacteria bacterium]